jgi:hypothetical protein
MRYIREYDSGFQMQFPGPRDIRDIKPVLRENVDGQMSDIWSKLEDRWTLGEGTELERMEAAYEKYKGFKGNKDEMALVKVAVWSWLFDLLYRLVLDAKTARDTEEEANMRKAVIVECRTKLVKWRKTLPKK